MQTRRGSVDAGQSASGRDVVKLIGEIEATVVHVFSSVAGGSAGDMRMEFIKGQLPVLRKKLQAILTLISEWRPPSTVAGLWDIRGPICFSLIGANAFLFSAVEEFVTLMEFSHSCRLMLYLFKISMKYFSHLRKSIGPDGSADFESIQNFVLDTLIRRRCFQRECFLLSNILKMPVEAKSSNRTIVPCRFNTCKGQCLANSTNANVCKAHDSQVSALSSMLELLLKSSESAERDTMCEFVEWVLRDGKSTTCKRFLQQIAQSPSTLVCSFALSPTVIQSVTCQRVPNQPDLSEPNIVDLSTSFRGQSSILLQDVFNLMRSSDDDRSEAPWDVVLKWSDFDNPAARSVPSPFSSQVTTKLQNISATNASTVSLRRVNGAETVANVLFQHALSLSYLASDQQEYSATRIEFLWGHAFPFACQEQFDRLTSAMPSDAVLALKQAIMTAAMSASRELLADVKQSADRLTKISGAAFEDKLDRFQLELRSHPFVQEYSKCADCPRVVQTFSLLSLSWSLLKDIYLRFAEVSKQRADARLRDSGDIKLSGTVPEDEQDERVVIELTYLSDAIPSTATVESLIGHAMGKTLEEINSKLIRWVQGAKSAKADVRATINAHACSLIAQVFPKSLSDLIIYCRSMGGKCATSLTEAVNVLSVCAAETQAKALKGIVLSNACRLHVRAASILHEKMRQRVSETALFDEREVAAISDILSIRFTADIFNFQFVRDTFPSATSVMKSIVDDLESSWSIVLAFCDEFVAHIFPSVATSVSLYALSSGLQFLKPLAPSVSRTALDFLDANVHRFVSSEIAKEANTLPTKLLRFFRANGSLCADKSIRQVSLCCL
jgi:hypothetical protein